MESRAVVEGESGRVVSMGTRTASLDLEDPGLLSASAIPGPSPNPVLSLCIGIAPSPKPYTLNPEYLVLCHGTTFLKIAAPTRSFPSLTKHPTTIPQSSLSRNLVHLTS